MPRGRYTKTVVIPGRVVDGCLHYFYGGPLPQLAEGTVFDLVVPEGAIKDPAVARKLTSTRKYVLAGPGTVLYCSVGMGTIPTNLAGHAVTADGLSRRFKEEINARFPAKLFVEVVLKGELVLELRGSKKAHVLGTECWIPSLGQKATSLNHTYRLISEAFEPNRISHAGNVFSEMLWVDSEEWGDLNGLRRVAEAQNESTLMAPPKVG